ncbi:hypothetical protein QAD02_012848 [Eretmocerus hayati]|uniref:Uncharacterized protein n=1 Tax=Eretmocerus hayati TaxID=131215 RepID=A0ACC2P0W5_9HYME|nr:hypothetical protein QAD02_012848 [Eretmocerus hayati]
MNLPIVDWRSGTDLRKNSEDELWKLPNIGDETLICTTCRRALREYEPDSQQESTPQSDKPNSQGSTSQKLNVTHSINCVLGFEYLSDLILIRSEKVKILALLPETWSVQRVCNEFDVSRRFMESAKIIRRNRDENDIADNESRGRPSLDASVEKRLIEFYLNDENSRQLPVEKM